MKPVYFYSDPLLEDADCMFDGTYRWLITLDNVNTFLSELLRSRTLGYLQHLSIEQGMDVRLLFSTKEFSSGEYVLPSQSP